MTTSLDRARSVLDAFKLDAILVTSGFTRRYLTGYSAHDDAPDESAGIAVVSRTSATLYTSANNSAWAASETRDFDVRAWTWPWESCVASAMRDAGWRRVGVEDRALVISSLAALQTAANEIEWISLGSAMDDLRAIKTEHEIELLETAIRLTDEVFNAIAPLVVEGATEAEIGWQIERLTRELAKAEVAFPPIVASGPNAARPHHGVTDRAIQPGEPVIIDMGVAWRGYAGDLTRTLWVGDAPDRLRAVYNAVYRANAEAIAMIAAGVNGKDVNNHARDLLAGAGFEKFVVHGLGHGLGLRVHETPSLSSRSDVILQAGHVVTVEPGLYDPDWGGVRIEDVVLVTEHGCRVLSGAPKHAGWMD